MRVQLLDVITDGYLFLFSLQPFLRSTALFFDRNYQWLGTQVLVTH